MSVNKHINVNDGSQRKYEDQTVGEIVLDTKPELNSFNGVTSDAVARAVAGASGEVPQVTEDDNGKVLKAVYDEGGPGVEWGEAGGSVDQSYDPTSENAQSGTAVAEAIAGVNQVPDPTGVPNDSVLAMGNNGMEWRAGGVVSYMNITSGTAVINRDNTVVTSTADITSIEIGANVKSAIVQWTVNSTTTLPTVTSGGSPLGASVNNPASLTVGHVVQVSILNGTWVCAEFIDPFNPLELPSHTIRCKFEAGYTPTQGDSQTLVDAQDNIWDISKSGDWWFLFNTCSELLEVLGANTTGVTNNMYAMFSGCSNLTTVPLFNTSHVVDMSNMFSGCSSLASVPLFNTSNVTNMASMFSDCSSLTSVPLFDTSSATAVNNMFEGCGSLTSVPLFDTSSVTNMAGMFANCTGLTSVPLFDTSSATTMNNMFSYCVNTESGALALYQQASSQATPPSSHDDCFHECGSYTSTGAAELAQIPASWGGTGA